MHYVWFAQLARGGISGPAQSQHQLLFHKLLRCILYAWYMPKVPAVRFVALSTSEGCSPDQYGLHPSVRWVEQAIAGRRQVPSQR